MSSKLEQLKQMTQVVADTGDLEAIRRYRPLDATTNPSLVLKALELPDYQAFLQQARQQAYDEGVSVYDTFAALLACKLQEQLPGLVSVEVDARTSFDTQASIARARQLITRIQDAGGDSSRILIKLAATWEGIQAAQQLEKEGIRCNLTLIFGFAQARACADAGVTLISPFVGRILDWYAAQNPSHHYQGKDDPGVQSVENIYRYYKERGYPTIIMGASFRNLGQIESLAGCDRLTISPQLLAELAEDSGTLTRQLSPQASSKEREAPLTEAEFRFALNQDAMATEKLADGIRRFIADLEALEATLESS